MTFCVACGHPAEHDHHICGRGIAAATVPVCRSCHDDVHARLRGLGYDHPADVLCEGPLGRSELGLRRLVVFLDWCDDLGIPAPIGPVEDALAALAGLLADALEQGARTR